VILDFVFVSDFVLRIWIFPAKFTLSEAEGAGTICVIFWIFSEFLLTTFLIWGILSDIEGRELDYGQRLKSHDRKRVVI